MPCFSMFKALGKEPPQLACNLLDALLIKKPRCPCAASRGGSGGVSSDRGKQDTAYRRPRKKLVLDRCVDARERFLLDHFQNGEKSAAIVCAVLILCVQHIQFTSVHDIHACKARLDDSDSVTADRIKLISCVLRIRLRPPHRRIDSGDTVSR